MPKRETKRESDQGAASRPVSLSIGGRTYRVRGSDPAALRRIAARVDGTLKALAGPDRAPDDFKLAVLTALNIAGEEDDARTAWIERVAALRGRAGDLARRLERLRASLPPADETRHPGG